MVTNAYYLVATWIGVPLWILGIIENLGTWKSFILFVLGAIGLIIRMYFFVVKQIDDKKKREIQLQNDILDLLIKKRENEED